MLDWKEYEVGIHYLYDKLVSKGYPNLQIARNQMVRGKSGLNHEIDVLITFDLLNVKRYMLIECKSYSKRKVEKSDVMILQSKIDDIRSALGIIVTTKGFQSGAQEYADYFGITTMVVDDLQITVEATKSILKVVLPDTFDLPKPFYTIMEVKNGENTGSYKMINNKDKLAFMLFLSKKEATKWLKDDEQVYPVTVEHLRVICKYADRFNKGIIGFFGYAEEGIPLLPDQVKELYLD